MSNEQLGNQIVSAVKFIQHIHRDLQVLIEHADKLFSERGWKAPAPKKVFARLGNRLNPKLWLLTYLFRYYVPRAEAAPKEIIAIVPLLDPPAGFQEPICAVLSIVLSNPVKKAAFIKHRKLFRRLIDDRKGQLGAIDLIAEQLPKELGATRARISAVQLCALANEADLLNNLVEPATGAFHCETK